MSDRCESCGKWNQEGLNKLAENSRKNPIYGSDFSKPLSQLVEEARNKITAVRGQLSDIGHAYPGWKERVDHVEGALTCCLVALAYSADEMREVERKHKS